MAKLLVVDDDPDVSDALRDALFDEGHAVHLAANGREAIEQVIRHRPDLVLLDVGLPILTGPEVAFTIFLKDAGLDEIPIVLVSAELNLSRIAQGVGTPYFVRKPFSIEALIDVVNQALLERIPPRPAQPGAT